MSSRSNNRARILRRTALVLALGMGISGIAYGQATSGSIFGTAQAGQTVTATGQSGVTRTATVNAEGNYTINNLPVGEYTVTLSGKPQSGQDVTVTPAAGSEVDFGGAGANAQNISAITVSANSLPAIDVSSVTSRSVITARQLDDLPLPRSAEAIALLAPGTVSGSPSFSGPLGNTLVSFGGAGVSENAYYINGMNVTDPLSGLGGISLPYGSIKQQQTLTGGYSAAFGRSDGGVINQIGKSGTNEWHFGARVLWRPDFAGGDPKNVHYPAASPNAGKLRQYREDNEFSATTYDAYVGGPLVKDRLFMFASYEARKTSSKTVTAITQPQLNSSENYDPKWYAKLDWNITDNNILELTGASTKNSFSGNTYGYDYDTHDTGDFIATEQHSKTSARMWIAKYTGYLTDNFTVSAQYGEQKTDLYSQLPEGFNPDLISVLGADQQDPAITGGNPITNDQVVATTVSNPAHQTKGRDYRIDLTWTLGNHTVTAGIDNQRTQDLNDGTFIPTNAGFSYEYAQVNNPNEPISPEVGAPGGQGYYVDKYIIGSSASIMVDQRAQYIEDKWQVTPRLLLSIGLRNDQFTNYNNFNQAYIRQHQPQLAPRLGFSWDVDGDSSFKVYGNAGRYYLALPTSLALRGASGSLFTRQYYTYTGINDKGYPTGLKPIPTSKGPGAPISSNNEYGQPPDPKTVTDRNLKSQYQDEYILGFDKKLNASWTYGVKATYRRLQTAIDDTCNKQLFFAAAQAQGLDTDQLRGCYFINPGNGATFLLPNGEGGYGTLKLSRQQLDLQHAKRDYYSVDLYLAHAFDGKWSGRVDYIYGRNYGNTEGQVKSDIGQDDISATQDWDYPSLMDYAGGTLANSRKHTLKIHGTYRFSPEWAISAVGLIQSGAPTDCLGFYGADQTAPAYPGPYYHFCDGKPVKSGTAGDLPWTKRLSLNLQYRPAFANGKLAFNADVYNVFNEQNPTRIYPYNLSNYRLVTAYEAPRYVRFGVSYDF